jgi:type IV secretory pathway TrbF-like protein
MISETTVGIQTLIGVVQVLASVIAAVASAFAVKWAKEAVDHGRQRSATAGNGR